MGCPKCKCQVTYEYGNSEYMERCANCGCIFDIELEADEDTDYQIWDEEA